MRCRLPAAALLLLIASIPAAATIVTRFTLQDITFAGGRVAFLASGLVVLDVNTGAVVARDRSVGSARLIETAHGIVVATWQGERRPRARLYSTAGSPAWDVACDLWHAGQDHLVCVTGEWFSRNLVIQVRSMGDGQVRWSWATGGRGGEALDAGNRLMIVNEDQVYERHAYHASYGPVTSSGYFPHATKLTVLDLATGQVLAAADLPGFGLYGWSGSTPPNYEFTGDRVVMRVRGRPGCAMTAMSYVLDAPAARFQTSESCEQVVQAQGQPAVEPTWTAVETGLAPRMHRLQEGGLVSFHRIQSGTLLERRSSRSEPWQLILRNREVAGWELGRVLERDGGVFVESNAWTFGTLDRVDLDTGRPQWRYVFPAGSALASAGVFGVPSGVGRISASDWSARQASPPPPLVGLVTPLPLERFQDPSDDPIAGLPQHDPAPTVFDPAAVQPWSEVVAAAGRAWLPIGFGAVLGLLPLMALASLVLM